jgi:hypothetical protein
MGRKGGTYGKGETLQKFCVKNLVEKTTWKRRGCENDITDLKGKKSMVAGWINLAEERDKWWVIISMAMNLRVQ